MKKHFSLRYKLILIFGLLIVLATTIEGLLAVNTARKAVVEKIETHLIDKAADTATIIEGRITTFVQFLEGIARMPILSDPSISNTEKLTLLQKEAAFSSDIVELDFSDLDGTVHSIDGDAQIGDREWFKIARSGKTFISEPLISRTTQKLLQVISVPIYDNNHQIIGVLSADINGLWLSDQINDIVVGKTGECYVLGLEGSAAAHKDPKMVENRYNPVEEAKKDTHAASLGAFIKHALEVEESEVGYYEFRGVSYIASYATMKTTKWKIIIKAPVNEFMGTVNSLRNRMLFIGLMILISTLAVTFFVARAVVKPIQTAVTALQNIAQGEGDLTVRLPVTGNDEITDMAEYFNQTIIKISTSIRQVGINSNTMEEIGDELASNMTETASAVNQISANIDGVKQQKLSVPSSS